MAKILLGATLGDARGSVGGVTYTKGRFGAVLRQKVSPVQPRGAVVLTNRGLFAGLAKRWFGTLTDAQRLGWIALAAANPRTNVFGNSIILTGLQMYIGLNRNIQQVGAAVIDAPPPNLDVDGLTTLTATPNGTLSTFSIAFTPTPTPGSHHLIIEASMQVNAGRSFVSSFYRFIQFFPDPQTSPVTIFTNYTGIWGALRIGQRITVRASLKRSDTGASSVPIVDTAIVV